MKRVCALAVVCLLAAGGRAGDTAKAADGSAAPRRLAVVDFRPYGTQFEWHGQKSSTVEWVKSLSDKLNVRFAKTRGFSMLDRKFVAELNDELAGLKDENVDPADAVRKAKRLVTDLLVVGEVRFHPVLAPAADPVTGRAAAVVSQLFAEVSYRVVDAPSGRLLHADVVKIDAASFSVSGVGDFVSQTTDAAASLVVDGVMANCASDVAGTAAVETVNRTPIPSVPPTVPPSTVKGNGTGGVVTPF